ncbi:MAG: metallophosphoesterase [Burkholderiaceae bacterium]|nr:metallophosphoesterase [Burkholderiales bacterium]MCZ8339729.1 metallophosphoesterase [Burkholderiaceae bacterium]
MMLTTPIIAVGDTQEHHSTGYPLHDNDSAVDAYVEVTQRPPEQPLFGRRILEWALTRHQDEPFIHLGDLLDLSCRNEARRVRDTFRTVRSPGAILPGNHDGLMFGIYGYDVLAAALDPGAAKWNRACRRGASPDDAGHRTGNEALTKRDFIAMYFEALTEGPRPLPGLQPPPASGERRVSWRDPRPSAYLSAIEAKVLDGHRYADSFLAQRLRLPRAPGATRGVVLIGLDTNQAGALVSTWDTLMGRSPGSQGHVHPDQLLAIEGWLDEAIRDGDIVVFAGHHNWRSLGLPTRTLLRSVMGRLDHPLVYLSAHTHSGFWAVHRELARRPLLELNVSSLSDWPIAYRRISFAYDEEARRLRVRGELMPSGDVPSATYADLLAAWERDTCARTGVPAEMIRELDLVTVKRQRESRGTLVEWLLLAVGPACETCEQPLFDHANAYLDAMLQVLLQGDAIVKSNMTGVQFPKAPLPSWCGPRTFPDCANGLIAEKPGDYQANVTLFRRKAELIETFNGFLDRLDQPEVKAYMTCRAVVAAKIDFDATDEGNTDDRSEDKRRAEQFFRIEASVGME